MTSKMIVIAAAVMALASGGAAQAGFVVNITQSGGNVLVNGTGSLDLTYLTLLANGSSPTGSLVPSQGVIDIHGPNNSTSTQTYGSLTDSITDPGSIIGPSSFGPGSFTSFPSSGSVGATSEIGIAYIFAGATQLTVYSGYVSGTQVSDSMTFNGQTIASLGLTQGTYVYHWGAGAHADTFTINVAPASVPEPSSLMLMGFGGLSGLGYAWRRRRAQVAA